MTRTAIVTGGASGIGAALGAALVEQGGTVVLADVDGQAALRHAAALTERGPGAATGVALDVRDAAAVTDLVHDVSRTHGRLDLMFNNAGVAIAAEPDELSLEQWDRVLDVNLRGVVHGCSAAYPVMRQQGDGHIVNTASVAGLVPCPASLAPYSASKHAVVGLSLALRAAGADLGVRVSALCPGWIDTAMLDVPVGSGGTRDPHARSARTVLRENGIGLYAPDRLAADALRGVARNKALIVAPRTARAMALVARLAPGLALRQATAMTRRGRAGAAAPVPVPPA